MASYWVRLLIQSPLYFLRACLVLVDQVSYAVEEENTYSYALDQRRDFLHRGRFPLTDLATSGREDAH